MKFVLITGTCRNVRVKVKSTLFTEICSFQTILSTVWSKINRSAFTQIHFFKSNWFPIRQYLSLVPTFTTKPWSLSVFYFSTWIMCTKTALTVIYPCKTFSFGWRRVVFFLSPIIILNSIYVPDHDVKIAIACTINRCVFMFKKLGSLIPTGTEPMPTNAPIPTRAPLESSNLVHNHPPKDSTMVSSL